MASKNKHQQKKEPVTLVGIVKAVHSGDSIVVYNQQGQEKELFFSNIKAPKIARNDNQTDEDWAFQSREFLRKLAIGQQVNFTIEHKTDQGREYGTASIGSTNIVKEIVANGWATVKLPEDGKKARNELHEELIALYHQAESNGIGIFQKPTKASIRNFPKVNDQSRLFEEIKGSHNAIVEYIRDGSSFRVLLPSLHRVYIKLSGAEAPRIPRDLKVEPAPAYALEAKSFVEKNLLHRDVNITVRSPGDSDSEFYGTISFKGRDVAEELIRNGFAKFVAWNAPPQNKETLQNLENQAKQSKLRIWKSYSGQPASNNASKNQIIGKIREIRDAANLAIVDTSVNPPRRVQLTLSSIQVPRFGVKDKADEEYGYEAKEYVRKNFIGKKVRAELDFKREAVKGVPGKPDLPEKEFWSVYCGDVNLAVALVQNGLAKVAKGNSKDGRSPAFEELIIAEKSAQAANKNLWNKNKSAPVHNYSDLTLQTKEAKQRAKQFLPFFQRQPNAKIPAVVEYVLSPNRIKVYVPKENCMIVLGFEGIRTPKNSPIYDEAFEYVRDKLQQRDIHISVDSLDKVGSFIGVVYLQKKNFGLTLVEMGYATVSDTVDYSPIAADYKDAEDRAKAAKRKLWQYEVEDVKQTEDRSSNIIEIEEKKPKLISVTVSEIIDASNFYIHVEEEKEALDQLMNELNSTNLPLPPLNYAPKNGEIAIAKFSDKKWYRVKVLSSSSPNYTLLYIDYGNTEPNVNIKDIRPIPAQFMQRPPFAKECFLAYLSLPTGNDEYADEAAEYFHHLMWGKQLYATIEYKEGDKVFVAIGDGQLLANVALTSAGYALVNKHVRNPSSIIVKTLREEQERARAKRNGRWEYGDFENDD